MTVSGGGGLQRGGGSLDKGVARTRWVPKYFMPRGFATWTNGETRSEY